MNLQANFCCLVVEISKHRFVFAFYILARNYKTFMIFNIFNILAWNYKTFMIFKIFLILF